MLFSEPKIPQSGEYNPRIYTHDLFQCSSASRKFLNSLAALAALVLPLCFSALQRAENSSIPMLIRPSASNSQSFSALQRAENSSITIQRRAGTDGIACFSALQRAENSSIHSRDRGARAVEFVSVLFSEPKIPQSGATII